MSMGKIPKLRFKEFSEEWEEKQLSELCKLKAGKFVSASEISEKQEFEMFPCYGGNGIRGYVKTQTHEGDYTLIGRQGALCGNVQFTSGKFHATEHAVVVSPNEENDSLWLYYQLDRLNLNRYATGQAQPGLSVDVIEKVKTTSPFKLEQEKIASFLSAVDTKINQLTRKKEFLEQYKKGVMQKLFSQELRFKADDGSEFPEWEEKKLADFLILTLREMPTPKDNYLSIGVRSHGKGTFQKLDSDPKKISMDKLYQVHENDLIVSITFAWEGAIAIVKREDENGLVSHRFPTYLFDEKLATHKFFKYVITQKSFRLMLELISPGGAGRNRVMSKKDFLNLTWLMPSLEEQTKIANFFSAIDTKIDHVAKQLDEAKHFKKGLFQQMFV